MSTVEGEGEGEEVDEHSGGKERVRRWTSTVGGEGEGEEVNKHHVPLYLGGLSSQETTCCRTRDSYSFNIITAPSSDHC